MSDELTALRQGRGMWCAACHAVVIVPASRSQVEERNSLRCTGCGGIRWRSLSVEMFRSDPRFRLVDEPN